MIRKRLPRRLRHGEEATLVEWLTRPLPERGRELVTLGVVEPFTTAVKVSLAAALALTLPVLLYQLWSFLAPAVDERTQRIVSAFAALATALFAGGVAFAYFVILPRALSFLTTFNEDVFEIEIRASYYFSFVTLMLLATGLAFQMPMFILALVRLRILTAERLRRNRRVGFALMLVFAVLLPTVDPVSLALEVLPLIALFELSIHLAALMERRWSVEEEPQELAV